MPRGHGHSGECILSRNHTIHVPVMHCVWERRPTGPSQVVLCEVPDHHDAQETQRELGWTIATWRDRQMRALDHAQ